MSKDPALLFYIDKWISATLGMSSDFRAWYMDLIIYQFDKGPIPNDEDVLYTICRVKPSEFERFKQMLEQVLKQKFKLEDNFWSNSFANEVLQSRSNFKTKRTLSGNIGVVIKMARRIENVNETVISKLKNELFNLPIEEIEKLKDKQVLKQMLKLYINVNVDVDVNKDIVKEEESVREKKIDNSVFSKQALLSNQWIETTCMQSKITPDELTLKMQEFESYCISIVEQKTNYKDFVTHFTNWLKNNNNGISKTRSNTNQGYKPATVDREKLIQELTDDVANGNIPGSY